MFYLDLDEIDAVVEANWMISRNKFNIYNFRDNDHLKNDQLTIKEKIYAFLETKKISSKVKKIKLLTNLRTFGYIFNPVSFYFCFDDKDQPVCVVPEIGNTFGEIKPYFIGQEKLEKNKFSHQEKKNFYISPFIDVEIPLDFQLTVPSEKLNIQIDDYDDQGKFLYATMNGNRVELTAKNLLKCTFLFPFITLKVIGLIHWHALLLWLKKVPFYQKDDNLDQQKELYRARHKRQKDEA